MCTAISFHAEHHYFGRTLDYEHSFGEEVVLTPRNFPLPFRQLPTVERHHAILGMAHVEDGYPLYYDAMNDHGLAMAGLNFTRFARYEKEHGNAIAPHELIPWVLGRCRNTAEARSLLSHTSIAQMDFSQTLPAARLHWLIADREDCFVLEPLERGLRIYDNPTGVLTNDPPFDDQILQLSNFMHLSPEPPKNRFAPGLDLQPYSRGMGALGLPGDLSSQSRFVRAAFTVLNATRENGLCQFFHILGTVAQVRGCCRLEGGKQEHTLYTSCCDTSKGIYHYTTWQNRRINAVDMHREDLEGRTLVRFPISDGEDVRFRN